MITESEVVALFVEANPIPITSDEQKSPRALATSIDTAFDSADAEADVQHGDDAIVDYLQLRPHESYAPAERKRWIGALVAVAATILVVVGVVADGNSGDVVTDPASSPSAEDPVASPGGDVVTDPASSPSAEGPVVSPDLNGSVPSDERSGLVEGPAAFGGPGKQRMFGVTEGGPGLVAVGESDSNAAVWTSVDGITWTRVPHDKAIFGAAGMRGVTVGGPGLVAVGSEGGPGDSAVWTSVDGITWSRVPHDEATFGGGSMSSVVVAGPGLIAVGSVSDNDPDAIHTAGDAAVWTSVDGITWSRVPHDEAVFGRLDPESDEGDRQGMSSVAAGGPGLVAVGSSWDPGWSAAVWTSVDGLTWSRVPHEEETFRGGIMNGVAAGGPGLVAVGSVDSSATVWTSVDGITWSRVPRDETIFGDGWSVITTSSGLVAVGDDRSDAAVWTSVDGIAWSRVTHDQATGEAG